MYSHENLHGTNISVHHKNTITAYWILVKVTYSLKHSVLKYLLFLLHLYQNNSTAP